nr:MAG TPA: hypothetical protein [Caudoviricetes sp.]
MFVFCVNKFYILILTEINKLYKYFIQTLLYGNKK